MKIYIKSRWKRFVIPVPFILLRLSASILKSPWTMKHIPEKNRKYVEMIDLNQLLKCVGFLKRYSGLRIVEAKAKDGTEVVITI